MTSAGTGMAFDHFRERRLEHFACYAPAIGRYAPTGRTRSGRRSEGRLRLRGFHTVPGTTQGWEVDQDQVLGWLAKLPRPLALFAADPYPRRI